MQSEEIVVSESSPRLNQAQLTNYLKIEVCSDDIKDCEGSLIANPIARALSRATQRRWRVWDGRIAQEMVPPYRIVDLPTEVTTLWENAGVDPVAPFTFQIEWQDEAKAA